MPEPVRLKFRGTFEADVDKPHTCESGRWVLNIGSEITCEDRHSCDASAWIDRNSVEFTLVSAHEGPQPPPWEPERYDA